MKLLRNGMVAGLVTGLVTGLAAGFVLGRRYLDLVEVEGRSMAPAFQPGDRLLVEALTYRLRPPRVGEVALAADPRMPSRELLKRIAVVDLAAGEAILEGDAPDSSTDSRTFGPVPLASLRWRICGRYFRPPPADH